MAGGPRTAQRKRNMNTFARSTPYGALDHALLDDFWQRMAGRELPTGDVAQARLTLELDSEAKLTTAELKKQYRKLLQQHHPDKGGSTAKAQEISQAYRILCGQHN